MQTRSIRSTVSPLVLPALTLLTIFLAHLSEYRLYVPQGDDPSILSASAHNPAQWFTEGFSRYFIVYPEWTSSLTDFLRPGVNATIRICELCFGSHFIWYFACFYAAQMGICAIVVSVARKLAIPHTVVYILAALTALTPAFVGPGLESIAFHFDVWCGFFTLLALGLILQNRYGLAVCSLIAAVFTKESALYAPLASSITVYLLTRRKLLSAAMMLPLLLWIVTAKLIFVGRAAGIYSLQTGSKRSLLVNVAKGFLTWPAGIFAEHDLRLVLGDHRIASHVPILLLLLCNLFLWLMLSALAASCIQSLLKQPLHPTKSALNASLLVWLFGALSFGVLVGTNSRFGGSIYPLELLACAAPLGFVQHRHVRFLSSIGLGCLAAIFLWNARGVFAEKQPPSSPSMSALFQALKQHPAGLIYILNSAPSFASPPNIAEAADLPHSKLIILSEASGCPDRVPEAPSPAFQQSASGLHILSLLPPCATYHFDGVSPRILALGFANPLARKGVAQYTFPTGAVTKYAFADAQVPTEVNIGQELRIDLYPPENVPYALLYFDWSSQTFRCFGEAC